MKIVHISDLHYPKHGGTETLINKIINYYKDEDEKPLVICTGDILDTPPAYNNDTNYINAVNILEKLKTQQFKILICPGNHDLKKGGLKKRKRIYSNLIRFDKHYSSLLPTNLSLNGIGNNPLLNFPIIHKIDNKFFIGLNSMTYQPKTAKGMLGREQLTKLKNELSKIREDYQNPVITVYLHHNPFPFSLNVSKIPDFGDRIISNKLRLIDRKSFLKIVKGVNILLCGHLHYNKRQIKYENKYNINCIQLTGGSTDENEETWTEIETSTYKTKDIVL